MNGDGVCITSAPYSFIHSQFSVLSRSGDKITVGPHEDAYRRQQYSLSYSCRERHRQVYTVSAVNPLAVVAPRGHKRAAGERCSEGTPERGVGGCHTGTQPAAVSIVHECIYLHCGFCNRHFGLNVFSRKLKIAL